MQLPHAIFQNKDKIKTAYEATEKGIIVVQTSTDATVVKALQDHAAEVTDLAQRGMVAAHEAMMKNGGGMMGRGMMGRGMRGAMNDRNWYRVITAENNRSLVLLVRFGKRRFLFTGDLLEPGGAWIAPGNFHLTMRRQGTQLKAVLNQEQHEKEYRE